MRGTSVVSKYSRAYKFILAFCRQNDIKIRCLHAALWTGYCYPPQSRVVIIMSRGMTTAQFLSTSFHEIAHILSYRKGKFRFYHSLPRLRIANDMRKWLRQGLRAEIHTDAEAKKLMATHFPEIEFKGGYVGNPEGQKWFKEIWQYSIREKLKVLGKKK